MKFNKGQVIKYRDLRWVIFGATPSRNEFILVSGGGFKTVTLNELEKGAEVLDEKPEYIEVSQFNFREQIGPRQYRTYHKAPESFEAALKMAEEFGGIDFTDVKRRRWGCGTYRLTENNTYELVGGDWDSSG